MRHCGLDLGKKSSSFCIVDDDRRILREGKVRMREDKLTEVFGSMKPMRVVVESSIKTFWVADILEEFGHEVIVVNPGRTKAIGAARIKHDRLDARVLAELCCANLLAVVDRPSREVRLKRMSLVARDVAIKMRTQAINSIRSILDSEGYDIPSAREDRFLRLVDKKLEEVPEEMANAVAPLLAVVEHLNEVVASYDGCVEELARDDDTMKLLMTVPGVGPITAAVFVFVIRRWQRFSSGRAVGAYVGLVPSLYSSGKTHRLGRITKAGSRQLRCLLTLAAHALLRTKRDCALKQWALKLAERTGLKKAKVALARKLAGLLWAMWRDSRPFESRLAGAVCHEG